MKIISQEGGGVVGGKEQRKNFSCGRKALASKQRLISKTRLINLRLTYTK